MVRPATHRANGGALLALIVSTAPPGRTIRACGTSSSTSIPSEPFEKRGRRLGLTENGEVALSYARRILALNDELLDITRRAGISGVIRISGPQLVDIASPLSSCTPVATPAVCAPPSCNREQIRDEAGAR